MRIKVGDQWFAPEPGSPVMVLLSDADKANIMNMAEGATRYACFANGCQIGGDRAAAEQWMDKGPAG